MKRLLAALVMVSTLAACQPESSSAPEIPRLTDTYGCGFGFYLGSPDQTARLFVEYADFDAAMDGRVVMSASLEDDTWIARLDLGSDLFANWCDDVLEPDEPSPEVAESWQVTGTIEVLDLPAPGTCGPAVARLVGVVATTTEGEPNRMGDFEVANDFWGCFAG